jgi:hypothetical protein|tara:strand:+ start:2137 stop:3153 length:1017 start_codon:yes stop_codon:yes gene_type:complete
MTTKEEAFFGVKNTVEDPADMVQDEDNLAVEVVDDTPEEDRPYVNAETNTENDSESSEGDEKEITKVGRRAQDRIKKLKWEYHEERRAKEQAERMSEEAIRATQQLHTENQRLLELVKRSQSALDTQAEGRAKAAVSMAEDMLRRANELGDTEAIATAQKNLIEAKMIESNHGNVSSAVVNDWKSAVMQQQRQMDAQAQAYQQQYAEQYAEDQQVPQPDPKAIEWQQSNEWFGNDYEMTSFAYGVHDKIVSEGIDPDTDEYYQLIDSRVREVFPSYFNEGEGADVAQRQKAKSVVAPAKRGSGGGAPRTVKLTQTQVRIAKRLGLSPQQYAAQLVKES